MDEEEKGFVIKDRRSLDEKGQLKKEAPDKEKKEAPRRPEESGRKAERAEARGPLPEVNFSSLIFSLSSSALFNFGEIEDPQTKEKRKDLVLAKHAIDTIAMLKDKTRGNLTQEEEKFLESVLTDLRWRYVKETT